ncbi:lysophospholipid acyltransferase family protein [Candidatus Riflebacteria bacterium]
MKLKKTTLARIAAIYTKLCFSSKRMVRLVHRNSFEFYYERKPAIYVFWHCNAIEGIWFFRNNPHIYPMASLSEDGEIMSNFLGQFNLGSGLRGSETKGSITAIKDSIRLLKSGNSISYSLDGSKGPLKEVKTGPLLVSLHSNTPIIPLGIADSNHYKLKKSWDKTQVPIPFGSGFLVVGKPFYAKEKSENEKKRLKSLMRMVEKKALLSL